MTTNVSNPENLGRFAAIDPGRFQDAPPDREVVEGVWGARPHGLTLT